MKALIFDMDETLTPATQRMSEEMARMYPRFLTIGLKNLSV